ncbi:hypothetical protein M2360_001196 [Rhizobium sp. SG_E_25_P2]|uniref:hypothetical protein n=1 Tax=Rhizobium sp. SG_E_25_P2 TaxID=2879942 RepID=UPI0024762EC4|nr:hypothetical protein [Rhizobium sp. SG_E_25_P2]MDH6265806.1 hypothetical protein [Rhizobium sp. SG_E_25_P2]
MNNPNLPEEEEKPLDPTLEKVRRKMVRLLFVSSSAIIVALMAVLGALVYKAKNNSAAQQADTAPAAAQALTAPLATQTITLPKGFVNEATTVDGNRVWFSGTDASGRRVMIVHDIATGKTISDITVAVPEP